MPLTKLFDSLAGVCRHCGQKAGILQRHHPGCEQSAQEGWQQMVALAAQAAGTPTFNEQTLRQSMSTVAQRARHPGGPGQEHLPQRRTREPGPHRPGAGPAPRPGGPAPHRPGVGEPPVQLLQELAGIRGDPRGRHAGSGPRRLLRRRRRPGPVPRAYSLPVQEVRPVRGR